MNIFALSLNPKLAARYAVDRHTAKMVMEAVQILSTAHWMCRFKISNSSSAKIWTLRNLDKVYKPFTPWGLRRHVPIELRSQIDQSVHGCHAWAAEDLHNYRWLCELAHHLHEEWKYRYDHPASHEHACYAKLRWLRSNYPPKIPESGLTPFYLAMPERYWQDDPVQAYREFYRHGKSHLHVWTKRGAPKWL